MSCVDPHIEKHEFVCLILSLCPLLKYEALGYLLRGKKVWKIICIIFQRFKKFSGELLLLVLLLLESEPGVCPSSQKGLYYPGIHQAQLSSFWYSMFLDYCYYFYNCYYLFCFYTSPLNICHWLQGWKTNEKKYLARPAVFVYILAFYEENVENEIYTNTFSSILKMIPLYCNCLVFFLTTS